MSWIRLAVVPIILCAVVLPARRTAADGAEKPELGWVETVRILPENLVLSAKLDTGADTSSIGATNLTEFDRDGRPWIRFSVTGRKGSATEFERPVVRTVRIKRSETETTTRPVVMLALCLGGKFREEAVTLTDRSRLVYPVLIGRSAMAGRFLENPSRKFTTRPDCLGR
jgi:hypothetical protein